jgi:hypothetical protein
MARPSRCRAPSPAAVVEHCAWAMRQGAGRAPQLGG